MVEIFITCLSILGGALIGVLSSRSLLGREKNVNRIEEQYKELSDQVKSYYQLEDIYLDEIVRLSPTTNKNTMKISCRAKVTGKGYERITYTESVADSKFKRVQDDLKSLLLFKPDPSQKIFVFSYFLFEAINTCVLFLVGDYHQFDVQLWPFNGTNLHAHYDWFDFSFYSLLPLFIYIEIKLIMEVVSYYKKKKR